jgi:CRISPR-associated endoribonuclease Cas6
MPSRWTLVLEADRPDAERPVPPRQLHGFAASLLEHAGTDHRSQDKPYTVSPLMAAPARSRAPHGRATTAVLHLGWLPDTPRPDLTRLTGTRIRLGAQFFTVASAHEDLMPYAALVRVPPAERAVLDFRSVTYFSRNGRWHPLPDPVLLYGGLIRRWNLFAPPQARLTDVEEKELLGAVALSAHDISSSPVSPDSGARIGFTGTAVFRLLDQHGPGPRTWQLFTALSLFAMVAGVGAQTTHGLGTVEVTLQ